MTVHRQMLDSEAEGETRRLARRAATVLRIQPENPLRLVKFKQKTDCEAVDTEHK